MSLGQRVQTILKERIEERYGYSAQWVLDGSGEKLSTNQLTAEKSELLKKIQKMSNCEVRAVLAFVNTLERLNKGD